MAIAAAGYVGAATGEPVVGEALSPSPGPVVEEAPVSAKPPRRGVTAGGKTWVEPPLGKWPQELRDMLRLFWRCQRCDEWERNHVCRDLCTMCRISGHTEEDSHLQQNSLVMDPWGRIIGEYQNLFEIAVDL